MATLWPDIRTHISIFDLNELQGMKVVKSLENDTTSGTNHASFSFHHCNVASWDSLAEAFADVVTQRSKIDIVFANAGVAEKGAFLQLSASKEPKKPNMLSCDINFYGVLYSECWTFFMRTLQLTFVLCSRESSYTLYENEPDLAPKFSEGAHHLYSLQFWTISVCSRTHVCRCQTWCGWACSVPGSTTRSG